ncbi:MAG: RluA family pseudouridine synthase [Holophagaceae bacterium]
MRLTVLEPGRLDRFLAAAGPTVSRARWEAWIDEGRVVVNGAPATKGGHKLKAGDVVETEVPELQPPARHVEGEDLPLTTLFEDDRLWIVDKPSGMVVHPGPGHAGGTLLNALVGRVGGSLGAAPADIDDAEEDGEGDEEARSPYPGLVHRLDRYTTGCIVMAKDLEAWTALQAQFKARTVEKRYLALVRHSRKLPELGSLLVDQPIARHKVDRLRMTIAAAGRPAQTRFRVLARTPQAALVECELLTGRTHQIRVHLQHLGAPLFGDALYGGARRWLDAERRPLDMPHPLLHAWKLAVDHPRDGRRLEVVAALPAAFREAAARFGLALPPEGA